MQAEALREEAQAVQRYIAELKREGRKRSGAKCTTLAQEEQGLLDCARTLTDQAETFILDHAKVLVLPTL